MRAACSGSTWGCYPSCLLAFVQALMAQTPHVQAADAWTCAWFRLQLAYLMRSLCLASLSLVLLTSPSHFLQFPKPTPVLAYFPTVFSLLRSCLSHHLQGCARRQERLLTRGLPCAVSWWGVPLGWRELAEWRGRLEFWRRCTQSRWSCSQRTWLQTNQEIQLSELIIHWAA